MTDFFPHETIRRGQDQLLKDSQEVIQQQKILLAHAPTGLGKTACALSAALKEALDNNKKVFFLTNRHTQHKIAIDTLRLLQEKTGQEMTCVDLIGKRWMCNQEVAGLFGTDFNEFCKAVVDKGECEFYNNTHKKKELSVEGKRVLQELKRKGPLHNEEVISICKDEKLCSYELSLALAKEAKLIIGDYNYIFNPFVQANILNKIGVSLSDIILIVDEAHNLPNRVIDMLSSFLTTNMLKNGILEAKKFRYNGIIKWLEELDDILEDLNHEQERLVRKEEFSNKVKEIVDPQELITDLEISAEEIRKKQRKSFLGGIANFLIEWEGDDEGYTRIILKKDSKYGPFISLSYSCLDPRKITHDIFAAVHSAILMSGTLNPTFMYKDLLGIERGVERDYNSPFPTENKLSLVVPETTTKYTLRGEQMYKMIAQKCSELSALIPGNVAIFFPSYHFRDDVSNFIVSDKKLFWEKSEMSKEEKEEFLEGFKESKEGLLLGVTGANFAEGVDFPGDLLMAVIVVGLPLGRPDLKTKETISYYEDKFNKGWNYGYIYPAMNKCIQSAGRCIRSETDTGIIIYLDERFAWQRYYECFPDRVGLMVCKDYEGRIKGFLSS